MLSIIIVNWNTRNLLDSCLESIRRYTPTVPCEILVVDNSSSDGSAEMVKAKHANVILLEQNANLGYARGNNLAFERAQGDFLLTLNPDTLLEDNSLQVALDLLKKCKECGALSVKFVGLDGETQASVRGFPSFLGLFGDYTGLGRIFPNTRLGSYRLRRFDYEKEQTAPQPMGTFLLFRREALESVGDAKHPFDENFPIYFNEVDLLYRMSKAGWKTLYTPAAHIRHVHGASTRQRRKGMIWESHLSLLRYLRKHWSALQCIFVLPGLALLVCLSAFVRARGFHAGFRS